MFSIKASTTVPFFTAFSLGENNPTAELIESLFVSFMALLQISLFQ
jgi:hypothetical protein